MIEKQMKINPTDSGPDKSIDSGQQLSWAMKFGYLDLVILGFGFLIGIIYLLVRTYFGVSALDMLVGANEEELKETVALGIGMFIAFSFVGIFTSFHLIVARELLVTSPKCHTPEDTLKLLWLCKTSDKLMLGINIIAVGMFYPDIKTCAYLILFAGPLFVVLLSIMVVESAYKIEMYIDEEKRLLKGDFYKSGLAVLEKSGII